MRTTDLANDACRFSLLTALLAYADEDVVSCHMPGHKDGRGALPAARDALGAELYELDKTMIVSQRLDSFFAPRSCLKNTLERLARQVGSDHSRIMLNGARTAFLGLLTAEMVAGRCVGTPRPAAPAVVDAAGMVGTSLRLIPGRCDPRTGFARYPAFDAPGFWEQVRPQPSTIVLRDSLGEDSGLGPLCRLANVTPGGCGRLAIEQCCPTGSPTSFQDTARSALESGAHIVIQHGAAVPALSQVAFMHIKGLASHDILQLDELADVFHVSSVSYPLLASADAAISGITPLPAVGEQLLARAELLRQRLTALDRFQVLATTARACLVVGVDPTRGPRPARVRDYLWTRHGIELGPVGCRGFAVALTPDPLSETSDSRLVAALREVAQFPDETLEAPPPVERCLEAAFPVRDALRQSYTAVAPPEAAGRVAARSILDEDLGLVVVAPGEVVDRETAAWIESHHKQSGNRSARLVRVLT